MFVRSALLLPLLLVFTTPCLGQDDKDELFEKPRAEWIALVKAKDVKQRRAAVFAMEVYGAKKPGITPALLEALEKDTEPEIRRQVALALGRMGVEAKGAVEALGQTLKADKEGIVREAAATALGEKLVEKAESQIAFLASALSDPHPGTRAAAAATLRNMGDKAKEALPQLIEVAKDKKAERIPRLIAIQMVVRLAAGEADTVKLLQGIYEDAEALVPVRQAALQGLGALGSNAGPAAASVAAGLKDKNLDIRRAAAVALAKIGGDAKGQWKQVKDGLKDDDTAVRHQLIRLTGILAQEEKECVGELVGLAKNDVNVENRLAAIQELGQLGSLAAEAVETLTNLAEFDTRASIRDAAEAALKKIKS